MRNYSIDTIKFFAAFAVVIIHVQPFRYFEGALYQELYLIIRVLVSFAVPFFFASTGYLFYKKIMNNDNQFTYLIKYLKKICKYLFITIIAYTLYNTIILSLSSNPIENIKHFISSIIKIENVYYGIDSGGMFHLWYLFVPLYVLPIVYIFKDRINLLTLIFLLFNIVGIFIQIYDIGINVRDPLFYGGFYICLGCLICRHERVLSQINFKDKSLLLMFFVFNLLQIYESHIFGRMTYSFSTIIITILIFIIIIKHNYILRDSIVNKVGSESLGIYLIHPMIIGIIYLMIHKMNINEISNSVLWQITFTPIVFVVSYLMYKGLKKMKKLLSRIVA